MANNSEDGDVIILLLPVWLSVGLAESKERAKKKKRQQPHVPLTTPLTVGLGL